MCKAVVLALAALLAVATGAPTTEAPNPLANLSHRTQVILNSTMEVTSAIFQLHNEYATFYDVTSVEAAAVKSMVTKVKAQKHQIHVVKVDINAMLSTLVSYQIQERSVLEFSRISLERYEKVLDKMAMNMLGASAGITKILKERVSEELSTAIALENAKLMKMAKEIAEIDSELQIVRSDAADGSGKQAQKVVLEKLNSIIRRSESIRNDMSQAWLSDLEEGVVDGLETNMLQSALMDTLLASLVWFENYCRNYQELMQKILGGQDKF